MPVQSNQSDRHDLSNMFVDNQPESETETVDDDDESDNDSSKYYLNKKLP
jgi:hypothetical protein